MFQNSPESSTGFDMSSKATLLEQEAASHYDKGNIWQARVSQSEALKAWEACNDPERQATSAHTLGFLSFTLNDHTAALAAYKQAMDLRTQRKDSYGMAVTLGRMAEVHQQLGNHANAIQLLLQALAYWSNCEHHRETGVVLNNIGVSYNALGQRDIAKRYHGQSMAIRKQIDDQEGLAATYHNLSSIHLDEMNLTEASRCLEEAIRIREALGKKGEIGRSVLQQGVLHEQQNDLEKAIACYERAWELATDPEVNDINDEASALHNLGTAASANGELDRGLRLLEQATSLFERIGKKCGVALSNYHRALTLRALGNMEDALYCLLVAKNLQEDICDCRGLAATLVAGGVILSECGLQSPAYDLLVRASRIQEKMEDWSRFRTLELLANVCNLQGRQEDALRYSSEATASKLAVPECAAQE